MTGRNPTSPRDAALRLISLAASGGAAGIGLARLARTWAGAGRDEASLASWIYQPGWTILQVALAVLATGAALVALGGPAGRRVPALFTAVVAAAVLGWSLNDGAYQIITSMYYLT